MASFFSAVGISLSLSRFNTSLLHLDSNHLDMILSREKIFWTDLLATATAQVPMTASALQHWHFSYYTAGWATCFKLSPRLGWVDSPESQPSSQDRRMTMSGKWMEHGKKAASDSLERHCWILEDNNSQTDKVLLAQPSQVCCSTCQLGMAYRNVVLCPPWSLSKCPEQNRKQYQK